MGTLLRLIAETVWPVRSNGRVVPRNNAYLKLLVILMIAIVAGPDFFAAMELTTLLELIGATMFLLSVAVGFWALGLSALGTLRKLVLPLEYVSLIRMREKPSAVFHGVSLVCRNGLFVYCMGLVAYAWISALVQLVP